METLVPELDDVTEELPLEVLVEEVEELKDVEEEELVVVVEEAEEDVVVCETTPK